MSALRSESALTTVEKKVLRQACTEKASDVRITDTCLGRDIDRHGQRSYAYEEMERICRGAAGCYGQTARNDLSLIREHPVS